MEKKVIQRAYKDVPVKLNDKILDHLFDEHCGNPGLEKTKMLI